MWKIMSQALQERIGVAGLYSRRRLTQRWRNGIQANIVQEIGLSGDAVPDGSRYRHQYSSALALAIVVCEQHMPVVERR